MKVTDYSRVVSARNARSSTIAKTKRRYIIQRHTKENEELNLHGSKQKFELVQLQQKIPSINQHISFRHATVF